MRTILISLQQLSAFLQLRTNLYISEQTSTATICKRIARAILIGGATSKTTRPPQLVAMHGRAGCLHRIHHISLFVWKVMRTPLKSLGVVISLRNTVFTEHEEQQTKNCLGSTIASIIVSTNVSMMVSLFSPPTSWRTSRCRPSWSASPSRPRPQTQCTSLGTSASAARL